MKKLIIGIIALSVLVLMIQKDFFPTPCDCAETFYYAKKYPLATKKDEIENCMELYFKEKNLSQKDAYSIDDFLDASYYFMNHEDLPCN